MALRTKTVSSWQVGIAAVLVLYASILIKSTSQQAVGSDTSGYMNAAAMLQRHQLVESVAILEQLYLPQNGYWASRFAPLGFRAGQSPGTIVPTYPLGFPLLLAALGVIVGLKHATLVVPILAVASVVLTWFIARAFSCSRSVAGLLAAILAVSPTLVLHAKQPLSDVPALFFVALSILLALRSDGRRWLMATAGLTMGMAIMVRPTAALAVPAVFAAAAARDWRSWLPLLIGLAPPAAAILAINATLYESPFTTGYGELQNLFSLSLSLSLSLSYL